MIYVYRCIESLNALICHTRILYLMYLNVCVCVYVFRIYMYSCLNINLYIYIYIFIYLFIHLFIYVFIYLYRHRRGCARNFSSWMFFGVLRDAGNDASRSNYNSRPSLVHLHSPSSKHCTILQGAFLRVLSWECFLCISHGL